MTPRRALLAVLLIYLVVASFRAITNRPWIDEAWFAGPAVELATHGGFGTPILDPSGSHLSLGEPRKVLSGINEHTYWVMPLQLIVQAAWGKVFGFSVWSIRFPSVLWGLLCLVSIWTIVERLCGNAWAATAGAGILAAEFGFLDAASDARMDMMCAALGFAGLAAYVRLREHSLARAMLAANLLIAASVFTHPNGLFAAFSLVLCVLWLDRKRVRASTLLIASLPYIGFAIPWLAFILHSPYDFWAQMGANASNRGSGILHPWTAIYEEIWLRHLYHHFLPLYAGAAALARSPGLVLFLAGIITAVFVPRIRHKRGVQILLWLTLLRFLSLALLANLKLPYYLIHILPFYAAVTGIAAYELWTSGHRPARLATAALLLGYFAAQSALWTRSVVVTRPYQKEYLPMTNIVRGLAGPNDLIDGGAELAFAFGFFDPRLTDDLWLGRFSGKSPSIVVVDQRYYASVIHPDNSTPYSRYIESELKSKFDLVATPTGYEIYRRRQPRP